MDPYPQAPLFANAVTNPSSITNTSNDAKNTGVSKTTTATGSVVPSLQDLFGDCFFTPEGETVFVNSQQQQQVNGTNNNNALITGTESQPTSSASRIGLDGNAVPLSQAGGISSTNLDKPGASALVMGPANSQGAHQSNPFVAPPQKDHHMGFAIPQVQPFSSSIVGTGRSGGRERKMSEQQKNERRERNREHAKRSRVRKKFLLESLQQSVQLLKEENSKLKGAIRTHLGDEKADSLLNPKNLEEMASVIASSSSDANKVLDDPDFSFIKALQTAQQNFVVTDPSLPDNPIVYATQGFLNLTGYTLDQVLGRNCRFLQGPETDPKAVDKIRKAIEAGSDMSVCLLNYRVDGTTFWNQFFIAALRDASGNITNYVGVQCKVSDQYAATVCKRQDEQQGSAADATATPVNPNSGSSASGRLETLNEGEETEEQT